MKLSYLFAKFVKNVLTPKAIYRSKIDRTARVCSGTSFHVVKLGAYSYVGHNCTVNDTEIGKFCSIANDCLIGASGHPVQWVSTSPAFHTAKNVLGKSFSENRFSVRETTTIGNDVWLGARVIVKSGIHIGNGAVIGAGSIVTKDVPAYEIWAGNPAKRIRERFDSQTAKKIEASVWWDWSKEKLCELGNTFSDPQVFCDQLSTTEA